MRLHKIFFSFGMIGALSFALEDFLGILLWRGYNPITSYVSQLTADGAPNVFLTRFLLAVYEICLAIFVVSMLVRSFQVSGVCLRLGYSGLLLLCALSAIGYGLFPMTMDFVVNPKNYIHIAVTVVILAGTIGLLFLLAFGYLRQEHNLKMGRITFVSAVLFLVFNLLHLYAIFNGLHALGLIQRLSLYTFQVYIFMLSRIYAVGQLSR